MSDCISIEASNLPILRAMANMTQEELTNRLGLLSQPVKTAQVGGKEAAMQDDVLQVFRLMANSELENIKKRQSDGICVAKSKGVRFGRPVKKLPENFTYLMR